MMQLQTLVSICVFSFLSSAVFTGGLIASDTRPASSNPLDAALQRVIKTPQSPFRLQVDCTDQKGIRSLDLFTGGIAIWNGRSQVTLPPGARSTLLETLLNHGFSNFAAHYGGNKHPIKTEAAARISCRIWAKVENLQKSSVQQTGGQQSTPLTRLATVLLDQAEQFTQNSITPNDLQDALDMLSAGQLAPQVLRLRFVDLPSRAMNKPGSILLVSGGQVSHRAYSPGHTIAEQVWKPLTNEQYLELLQGLQHAQPESLPGNLWSEDQLQFQVQVMAHKKAVLARPFVALDSSVQSDDQQRFNSLLTVLRKLDAR